MAISITPSPFGSVTVTLDGELGGTLAVSVLATSNSALDMALGVPGPAGATGAQGPAGTNGTNGVGVPTGGSAGQVLAKIDGTNYNTQWVNAATGNFLPLTGGSMTGDIIWPPDGNGIDSQIGSFGFGVENTSGQTAYIEPQEVRVYDTTNTTGTRLIASGVQFDDGSTQVTSGLPLTGGTMTGNLILDGAIGAGLSVNNYAEITTLIGDGIQIIAQNLTAPEAQIVNIYPQSLQVYQINASEETETFTVGLSGIQKTGASAFSLLADYGLTMDIGISFTPTTGLTLKADSSSKITFPDLSEQTTAFPPAGGTTAQYIDGTGALTTFPPLGDRYLTSSTTSLTIGNGAKTLTVDTGLSYSPLQEVTITYNVGNHMHASVTSYNSTTGVMVVDVSKHSGSGTYSAWTVNVGGVVAGTYLEIANNLSELTATASTARTNLGLGAVATDAYATNLQAVQNTSSTTVLSPANSRFASISTNVWAPGVTGLTAATSGTGANSGSTVTSLSGALIGPNASTAGYATRGFNLLFPSNSVNSGYNYGTESGHSVKVYSTAWASTVAGVKMRAVFGRMASTLPVPGTLAARGYGWEWDYSTKVISIIAHNGTSLTTTAQTWTPASNRNYDIAVYSNGAGTISLYIDGTLIGTGTGGPTTTSTTGQVWWQMEIENQVTAGSQQTIFYNNPKLITTNG